MAGPLKGVKIIEMAGIGPAPFCAMLLADMGAEVIRIERQEKADLGIPGRAPKFEVLHRGRKSVAVDVKSPEGRDVVLRLARSADALIEGFRPGVMERLGLGPAECSRANPRLVFGRMTGFGQDGPLAPRAGHDINYIALAGVLHGIGRKGEPPVPPLNLVGDFGGGGMFLAFGVVAALLEARTSGKGQVVDAAMIDGAAYLMGLMHGLYSMGSWVDERESNVLDGAAPWYGTYRTKDGKYVAIGSIERRFYEDLLQRLGLAGETLPKQHDRKGWPELRRRFAEVFASRTRAEWEQAFEGSDACFAPVLSIAEAPRHPHNALRSNLVERDGVLQPAPAPRFSRTVPEMGSAPVSAGANTDEVLRAWGFAEKELAALKSQGVVGVKA
jgi:alpha-methylacyl-CoA racemase